MFDTIKYVKSTSWSKVVVGSLGAMVLLGVVTLSTPSIASADSATNVFTLKGGYTGSVKLSPTNETCIYGKSYDGKSYLITMSHLKGLIKGAGKGPWAMTLYVPKTGTTTVAKIDATSESDSSIQGNGFPIVAFDETSGTITYNGSKGSFNLNLIYHVVGGSYGKSATVTGSWSC